MTTEPEWTDWTPHDGGPCPIPDAKAGEYELKFREYETDAIFQIEWNITEAASWDWTHTDDDGDIISYRTRKQP